MIQGGRKMNNVEAVIDFLQRCIEYSDASIKRKMDRGDSEELIQKWRNYREFTAHAIMEIERGELDDWFNSNIEIPDLKTHDIASMSHAERAAWLAGIASPRPVALISTQNELGGANLAPYSSMTVVSNTPPILAVSFSEDRSGRSRDTLTNLESTGKAEIQFLAATRDAAHDIDNCGATTEQSEWELLDSEGPIHPLALAVLECELIEVVNIPNAVARLALLKIVGLQCGLDKPPKHGLSSIAQHGMDQLSAIDVAWSHLATKHRD